jgi:arsenate reductase-like glutaredoxin family protein
LKNAKKLIAIKGKKVTQFDLVKDRPDEETLLSFLMGPTGNLRAPTAILGSLVVVGFNPEAYAEIFGI